MQTSSDEWASGAGDRKGAYGDGRGMHDRGGRAAVRSEAVQDRLQVIDGAQVQLHEVTASPVIR